MKNTQLDELYQQFKNQKYRAVKEISAAGSNRRYFRIFDEDNGTVIGAIGTSKEENIAFFAISSHFCKMGLSVPEVYAVSDDKMCYIMQDLGDLSLFSEVESGRSSGNYNNLERKLLLQTITQLPDIQFKGAEGFDFSVCYPQSEFDKRMISFDLNYFKYSFLKTSGLEFSEIKLDDDFNKLTEDLMSCHTTNTFLYRDFQARNVMIYEEKPYFIDFQGGRKGPIYYDVASFVWQAKANYPVDLREELIAAYYTSLSKYISIPEHEFRSKLLLFVFFRTLQVLGAYGFRGYFEGKQHFIDSVPFAVRNLQTLLTPQLHGSYPYLAEVFSQLTSLAKFQPITAPTKPTKLQITVFSFAYKNGVPDDGSGNGGGYAFDCRAIHNPGRYEPYKQLTGMDSEVIDFLEEDGEVFKFLHSVYILVDAHAQRFIDRKFSNMQVAFGCTGGQHRSVYCAESTARHLKDRFDVDVKVIHREQKVEKQL